MLLDRKCPKCSGLLVYEYDGREMARRCLCGWRETVYFQGRRTTYLKVEKAGRGNLPREGSMLRKCIQAIADRCPEVMSTADVSTFVEQDAKNVSAYLIVLMHRGLLDRVSGRKGMLGGSEWRATRVALEMLGMEVPHGFGDVRRAW